MIIFQIFIWYLIVQFLALAGVPLAFVWLRHLPSRGYAVAKALGILLSGVIFWWSGTLHIVPNTAGVIVALAIVIWGVGLWVARGAWSEVRDWWQENCIFVLTTEVLFMAAFLIWAVVRASQPQLETAGGEKWMEIAFLNAVLRSPYFPPHDPWLSGFAISYYYLGYILMGMLVKVAAIPSTVAFNLCNATWFALAAVGAYGIVYNMLKGSRVITALLGPLLVVGTGNGEGLMEIFHAWGLFPPAFWTWLDINKLNQPPEAPFAWVPQRFFWWWQASRTIRDLTPWGTHQEVIDEFPVFSFLLGDMHPHVLALPFVLLAVALALNRYYVQRSVSSNLASAGPDNLLDAVLSWDFLGTALVLGALGFLNTWDFPIYWAVIVGADAIARLRNAAQQRDILRSDDPEQDRCVAGVSVYWSRVVDVAWDLLPQAIILGVLSVALYFPFWVGLRSQAGGILPNLFNATRWQQFVVMFLPFLIPLGAIVVGAIRRVRAQLPQLLLWALALMAALFFVGALFGLASGYPYVAAILQGESVPGLEYPPDVFISALVRRLVNPWVALALAVGVVAIIVALLARSQPPDRKQATQDTETDFALLLSLVGLLLVLAPEFVFLKDVFNTRMNTIFKFYFQAWVLWGLVAAWQVGLWLDFDDLEGVKPVLLAGTALCVGAGLIYPVLAIPARAQEHHVPWTLDGSAWVAEDQPQDWLAIQWLNAKVDGRPVIVEAPAAGHRAYTYEGRVSALTGLPTILGWSGHELQWRGNYDEQALRERDLELIFTSTDTALVQALLERYDVTYVYIGPVEHALYPVEGLAKFENMLKSVYASHGVVIYER